MTTREKVNEMCEERFCTACPISVARKRKDCLDWAEPSCYEWAETHTDEFTQMYIRFRNARKMQRK